MHLTSVLDHAFLGRLGVARHAAAPDDAAIAEVHWPFSLYPAADSQTARVGAASIEALLGKRCTSAK